MEDNFKTKSKSVLKKTLKRVLPFVIIPIIFIIIVSAISYFLTVDDGIYKEGDMSSTPYAASTYINDVTVDKDGTIKSGKTAQELWDEMIKNGSRVDRYLSNPRELARLMKAEIVTQYPDTRKNPDEPIDWDEIIKNEDQLQGIVKLKRASNGQTADTATTMTYVDPATFQGYIEEYNNSGSEEAKQNALKHFTLKKSSTSTLRGTGGVGEFEKYTDLTEDQLKALATVALQEQGAGNLKGNAAELSLMANLYEREKNNGYSSVYDYVKRSGWFANASSYMDSFTTSGNGSIAEHPDVLELARIILVQGKRTLPGYVDEHDSLSDIADVTNDGVSINKSDPNQYEQYKSIIHQGGSVGGGQWTYYCHPTPESDPFGYTSEERRAQIGEFYYDFDTWEEKNKPTGGNSTAAGQDVSTDISQAILDATKTTPCPGLYRCLQWVDDVYTNAGISVNRLNSAYDSYLANGISSDKSAIPIGAAVYGTGSGNTGPFGHVGIYIGNGQVIDNVGSIQTQSLDDWIAWQENKPRNSNNVLTDLNGVSQHGWLGWGWPDGNTTRGVSGGTGISIDESKLFFVGDSWIAGLFEDCSPKIPKTNYYYGVVGASAVWSQMDISQINVPSDASGIVMYLGVNNPATYDAMNSLIDKLSEKYGKPVFVVDVTHVGRQDSSADSLNAEIDNYNQKVKEHCNSKSNVYFLDVASCVQDEQGYLTPNSSDGLHLTTQSDNQKWYDKIIEEINKKCGGSGSDTSNSRNSGNGYVAVVATWNQTNTTLETNDPNVQPYSTVRYSMTTTNVNYQAMVEKYTMPFDFLWALTVVGEEKDFIFELCDLVFGSDIQVTIYDNLTVNTTIDDWHYDHQRKTQVDIYISAYAGGSSAIRQHNNHEHVETNSYNTKKTVITYTNTINAVLTRANTWIVDYKNDYTYSEPTTTTTSSAATQADQNYPSTPESTGSSHSCDVTEQYKQSAIAEVKSKFAAANPKFVGPINVTVMEQYAVRYYSRYINIVDNITNSTETRKYIEGTPSVREKTDKAVDENGDPVELNFVTIFRKAKHITARKNITSVPQWLFEIVEENGKPDLDLVKYLLYKATGKDYGVTKYDFSQYDASKFKDVDSGITGGTIQEKVWFALKDLGYSDIAAAGAMGNIDYESAGFNPSTIEGGTGLGIGLCQWTNNSPNYVEGRRKQLETYAKSKGVEWKDEDTQVEFLIAELSGTGPASGYANRQFMNNKGYTESSFKNAISVEEATKAFCWTFERPNYSDGNSSMSERISRAQKYYRECPTWVRPSGSGEVLDVCEEVMNDMIKRNVHYSLTNLTSGNIKAASQHPYACCATYVSIVLYKSGLLTESQINAYNYNYTGDGGIPDMLRAAGWRQVQHSEIQPGDVINDYGNHVLIYAGGNKVYDQTCGVVSSSGRPPKGGPYDYWSHYKGNSNVQVWRSPKK